MAANPVPVPLKQIDSEVEPVSPRPLPFTEFVGLIAGLMALTGLSIDIMLPALPAIGASLGVATENERQLVVVLYMVGFAAGQLLYGPISDRFGRKPVLIAGLAIYALGTLVALLSASFDALLAGRLIQGMGAASPRVVAIAIVRDVYSGRQMARVMSFAMMVFILIPVFAPSIGQGLLLKSDWRLIFGALLAVSVALAGWAAGRLPETARGAASTAPRASVLESFWATVREPQTLGYGVASGFIFGCLLAYVASAEQVFVDVFHLGAAFPMVFGGIASVMAIASFLNARWVERTGMRAVSHTALVGLIGVAAALLAATVAGLSSLPVFAVHTAAIFFLFGLIAPNFNALAMEPQGRNAGMASSVVGSLSTAIGAAAGGIIGGAFDGSVMPIAIGFLACSVVSGAIVVAIEGRSGLFGHNRAA